MCNKKNGGRQLINPEMTVLDVVAAYKETLPVFKKYDLLAGECICCKSLFETIHSVSAIYGFDLKRLLDDLEAAVITQIKN
ncbi:hypothetical protein [Desulfobacula sp.]|uniref:hypothetical protein n=1 Tax=Desulfobacula sp. TaxID=2593537 RepID=UPI00263A0475|nr:hypothetical protein [Desulfobacula sp.]